MRTIQCTTGVLLVVTCVIACADPGSTVDPSVSSVHSGIVSVSPAVVSAGPDTRLVTVMDACDSTTFNAAVGPGTCSRAAGLNFTQFVDLLTAHQSVGAWQNDPSRMNARLGQALIAINRGGEVHTFTRVAQFGGGIVPFLNQLSGNTSVAPECQALAPQEFMTPGGTDTESLDETGVIRFQCCIHPWMRTTVRVRGS